MNLNSNTSQAEIDALGLPGRASETRRRNLERIASFCTTADVQISVQLSLETASARPSAADHSGNEYEIQIPTQKYTQQDTDAADRVWDRAIQIAFLFHELGHVHYSDFERFAELQDQVSGRWKNLFRSIYNASEDGVIETQIANEFNVERDLLILNQALVSHVEERHQRYINLFAQTDTETPQAKAYSMFEAIAIGLLDNGYLDSGRFDELLHRDNTTRCLLGGHQEELRALREPIDEFMMKMLSEPRGSKRVDLSYEFFKTVQSVLEDLPALQRKRVQTVPLKPTDVTEEGTWNPRRANHLPSEEALRRQNHRQRTRKTTSKPDQESQNLCPPGKASKPSFDEHYKRQTTTHHGSQNISKSPLVKEAQRLATLISEEDTAVDDILVVEPEDDHGNRDKWERATAASKRLISDLNSELRRERRPRDVPGYRTGRLNDNKLVSGYLGEQRIFTRRETGQQKDYSCLLLLDRSGSMEGSRIETAEVALGQLSHALFEVGVSVSVMSIWQGRACLELPFDAAPKNNISRLMTGRASGSTPLSELIDIARERIDLGHGKYPFTIVVTDGAPDDQERYRDALKRCSFPVFGVYVGWKPEGDTQFFDRIIHTQTNVLEQTMQQLIRQLFSKEV